MALGVVWLDVPLAVACLLAAVYHVGLLVARQVPVTPVASHAAMGLGMAAMFVPRFDPVPRLGWVAVFLLIGTWFGVAALRAGSLLGEPGHLTVGAVAMLFMLLGHGPIGSDGPVDAGHAGHAGDTAGLPGLLLTVAALGLAVWFIGDVVRRLAGPDDTGSPGITSGGAHRVLRLAAPLVMSSAMAIMLLGMA